MNQYSKQGAGLTELILNVFQAGGIFLAWGDNFTLPYGLTSSRWQVLGAVDQQPGTVSSIARRMGLQRQSVQRTVNILCEEGLVELEENPEHRTSKLVVLTKQGTAIMKKMMSVYAKTINDLADEIGVSEKRLMDAVHVIQQVSDHMKQEG